LTGLVTVSLMDFAAWGYPYIHWVMTLHKAGWFHRNSSDVENLKTSQVY